MVIQNSTLGPRNCVTHFEVRMCGCLGEKKLAIMTAKTESLPEPKKVDDKRHRSSYGTVRKVCNFLLFRGIVKGLVRFLEL